MAVSLTASVVMGCATMPRSMVGALIDQAPTPETESASKAVATDSPGSQSPFGSVDGLTASEKGSSTNQKAGIQLERQDIDASSSASGGISNSQEAGAEGGAEGEKGPPAPSPALGSDPDETTDGGIKVDPSKDVIDQDSNKVPAAHLTSSGEDPDPLAIRTPREPWNASYEVYGDAYEVMDSSLGYLEVGIASWYGKKFHGRKTSNGERFDMYQVSAAHKTLPIPTVVRVTNLENSKKIDVRINDRGPFHDDRLIDLSMAAARALGFSEQGTAPVVVEAIDAVNYPEQFVADDTPASVYLQAGAFQSVVAAEALMNKIEAALPETLAEVGLRELPSEQTGGVLHKVWIGPLTSPEHASEVTELLAGLGVKKPMRVQVD